MRRLIVNDVQTTIPGTRTFWHDLVEWSGGEFVGGEYGALADIADNAAAGASLIIRNASYFGPLKASATVPTIGLIQDILDGPARVTQELVAATCKRVVFNSEFTKAQYPGVKNGVVIPLPVNFDTFEIGNRMGLQQALGLPDRCVVWVGACSGAAGEIKGWDIFLSIVRRNPHIHFVAVFKDAMPDYGPVNLRMYSRLDQETLARVIGACKIGLCTSRRETQHLAGIEMGACGLHIVVPPVGTYWKREGMPGTIVQEPTVENYTAAINEMLNTPAGQESVRAYWSSEFSKWPVKAAWKRLIEEVSCTGQS